MTVEQIQKLAAGQKVFYKGGYIFIDRAEGYEYYPKSEYGFMTWRVTKNGSEPCNFHYCLFDALKELD